MATTPRLGLHVYGGDIPGSITDNGSQHTAADRYFLDQFLTQLATSPRHYTPATAAVGSAFSLDADVGGGRLQDGVTYFYRVALIGLDGFEKVASDETSIGMPDVLAAPAAPGARDASGGSLTTGLYYYALTAKSDTQESPLGSTTTVNVFAGVNQAINIDAPTDAQGVPLQVWRKKDTDPGFTRLGLTQAGGTFLDDGSVPANSFALDPAYAPPSSNRGNANNSVTITLVGDAAEAADQGTIKAWRIYRSTISGYYSAQSLVHEVVETDDEDGNGEGTLRTSWIDTGDALRAGQPQFKDRSIQLAPYAPQTVTALPTDTAAYPPNYLLVFDDDLYILKGGTWQLVGGGTKVTTSTEIPETAGRSEGDWHLLTVAGHPDVGYWLTLAGGQWMRVQGERGALFLGQGAPNADDYVFGDTYLDIDALTLYGPRVGTTAAGGGAWAHTITLAAPSGGGATPVLTSPNGSRFRTVVADDGTLSTVPTLEPGPPAVVTNLTLED